MRIKFFAAGAAIVLAATMGSAYAAEQFATLEGVSAAEMSAGEMAVVRGEGAHDLHVHVALGGTASPGAAVLATGLVRAGVFTVMTGKGIGLEVAGGKNPVIHFANHL